MLSEEVRQLLSAYVDGAVSTRQRKQVDRLLRKSAEARDLLEQLQRDSGELRALRRQRLPQDFSLQVLRSIAEKKLTPAPPPPAPKPFPAWLGGSIAAAVLLAVTAASFLYFSSLNRPSVNRPDALFALPNLDLSPDATLALSEKLAQAEAPRLNLECRDPAQAVERLEAALKGADIQVMVPESAKALLRKQAKVRYLLYAENVTAAELATMLQKMGGDDRRAQTAGGRGAGFGRVLVHQVTPEDRQQLSRLLGIDAKLLQPGALGRAVELQIPMHSDAAPPDKRGIPAENAGPISKGPARFALVLARTDGVGDVASSPEVRAFLKQRGPVRPGTLQVIVEIQPALG